MAKKKVEAASKVKHIPQVPPEIAAARKTQLKSAIGGLGKQIEMLQNRKKQLEERLKTL